MGRDRMRSDGPNFIAYIRSGPADEIQVSLADSIVNPNREFYLSLGPVSAWLTLSEIEKLRYEIDAACREHAGLGSPFEEV
jgi:hypothetical protein